MFSKLLILFLVITQFGAILIDKIAATVNDEVITISDIEKSLFFYPILKSEGESENDLYLKQLNNMINYKVIYLDNREQFELTDADFESLRLAAIARYGSIENFRMVLKNFDMKIKDFRDFVKEKVFFEKVIKEKFKFQISVNFEEIKKFYYSEYIPKQKKLGITPISLIEIAPKIENLLRTKQINDKLSGWLDEVKKSYKIAILLNKKRL